MSEPAAGTTHNHEGAAGADAADEVPFLVDLPSYHGTLEELVLAAQRGDVDLADVPVAEITSRFRARLAEADTAPSPRQVADFLSLAARLLSLKAARLLPEGGLEAPVPELDEGEVDDPGARLAEYRLFKAAAEALLSDVVEEGVRSFLGLVSPEVLPSERLSIAPERLAAAFRAVLERLPEEMPLGEEVERYSVDEKVAQLRALLAARSRLAFEEIFAEVRSRLEAVACFLALLEIIKAGEARVSQRGPFDTITVTAVG